MDSTGPAFELPLRAELGIGTHDFRISDSSKQISPQGGQSIHLRQQLLDLALLRS